MDNRKLQIGELNTEISSLQESIDQQLEKLGNILYSDHRSSLKRKSLNETVKEISDVTAEISGIDTSIRRIQEITKQLSTIEKERKSLLNDESELNEIMNNLYGRIGEAVFAYYQDNPFSETEHDGIFSELNKEVEDYTKREAELTRIEANVSEKPLLEKVVQKGKKVFLRSKVSSKLNTIKRLYTEAGRQVCESGFINDIEDRNVSVTAAPYFETKEKADSIRKQIEKLNTEEKHLREELSELGVEKKPDKRIDALEGRKKDLERRRGALYIRLALDFRKNQEEEISGSKKTAALISAIDNDESTITKKQSMIKRIQAAIDFDLLSIQVNEMERTIKSRDAQIKNYQEEIEELRSKIGGLEKEKKKLEKIKEDQGSSDSA
jgi:chromosome segregation ATPase